MGILDDSISINTINSTEVNPYSDVHPVEKEAAPAAKSDRWTPLSLLAFISLGAIWGSAFLFIKWAVEDENTAVPPMTMVMLRLAIGGIGMLFVLAFGLLVSKKLRHEVFESIMNPVTIMHLCIMGFFNNVIPFCFVGIAEGPLKTNVGVASILDATIPLFAMPIAHFFIPTERLTPLKTVGLSVGFLGVIMVCVQSVNIGSGKPFQINDILGCIFVTIASAGYGVASVYAKKYCTKIPGLLAATGQICSGAIMMVIICCFWDLGISRDHMGFWPRISVKAWISLAYLGLLSTLFAYVLYFYLINTVGSGKQSMVGYLLPVFGVIEGIIFLGDWNGIPWYYCVLEVVGAILIIGGIAIVDLEPMRYIRGILKFLGFVSSRSKKDDDGWGEIVKDSTGEKSRLIH